MFLKNFYALLGNGLLYTTGLKFKNYQGNEFELYDASLSYLPIGVVSTNNTGSTYSCMSRITTGYTSACGVILGTGTSPATIDDYKLSGSIVSGFKYTATKTSERTDDTATITYTYSITNENSTAMTISEVGITAYASTTGGSTYGLIERTVLSEPVVIPPEGVGQVRYSVTYRMPETY